MDSFPPHDIVTAVHKSRPRRLAALEFAWNHSAGQLACQKCFTGMRLNVTALARLDLKVKTKVGSLNFHTKLVKNHPDAARR